MNVTRDRSKIFGGIALIAFGVLVLFYNVGVLQMEHWWPLILVALGVAFFIGWANDTKQTGLLLPGAILVVIGFQFWFLHASWPIYLLAPAIGFWLMYFLGPKDVGLLIPAFILTVIALVYWFRDSVLYEYWPVLFIIAGIILIIWPRVFPRKESEKVEETEESGVKSE